MTEAEADTKEPGSEISPRGFLARDWPYVVMLALAVIGVAVASVAGPAMMAYWEILVPVFAAVCVWTRARETHPRQAGRSILLGDLGHCVQGVREGLPRPEGLLQTASTIQEADAVVVILARKKLRMRPIPHSRGHAIDIIGRTIHPIVGGVG